MSKQFLVGCVLVMTACGSTDSSQDDASKFVGEWTYQPGSSVVTTCPGQPPSTTDLSKTPPNGLPAKFTFSEIDASVIHEVDGVGCQYDWHVSGDVLHVDGQSCNTFPDGRGGVTTGTTTHATKSSSDGKQLVVDVTGTVGPSGACTLRVTGIARKD
jgi:hypothetical protein